MSRRFTAQVLLFVVCLAAMLVGWAFVGAFTGVDTKWYLLSGEKLIDWILAGMPESSRIYIEKLFIIPHYVISTTILVGVVKYLNLGWPGIVVLNSILFSLSVCMVVGILDSVCGVLRERREITLAVAACSVYIVLGLPDVPLWAYAILTESIFLFWVTAFVYLVSRGLWEDSHWFWFPAFLIAAAAPFVRPTGILLPLLCLFALGLYFIRNSNRILTPVAIASLVLPLLVVFLLLPLLVLLELNHHRAASVFVPDVFMGQFRQAATFFKNGLVIADRLELDVGRPISYFEIIRMMLYRIVYYLVPIRLDAYPYSLHHNAVNLVYMVVTVPLAVLGVKSLIRRSARHRTLLLFLVMTAYSFVLMHAATLVSYDWRYQLPGMVPLWVLAGFGCCRILGLDHAGGEGGAPDREKDTAGGMR